MVVKGIALHDSENQLRDFLLDEGIETSNWKALTTYDNARSLTFKFSVKAMDHEKSKDLKIWPAGVLWKHTRKEGSRQLETMAVHPREEAQDSKMIKLLR